MQDDVFLSAWDQTHAPLGVPREGAAAPPEPRRWGRLLVAAALAGMLAGLAPAGWRAVHPAARPVVALRAGSHPVIPPVATAAGDLDAFDELAGLEDRPTAGRPRLMDSPAASPRPPARPESRAPLPLPPPRVERAKSGPLIINGAEA